MKNLISFIFSFFFFSCLCFAQDTITVRQLIPTTGYCCKDLFNEYDPDIADKDVKNSWIMFSRINETTAIVTFLGKGQIGNLTIISTDPHGGKRQEINLGDVMFHGLLGLPVTFFLSKEKDRTTKHLTFKLTTNCGEYNSEKEYMFSFGTVLNY